MRKVRTGFMPPAGEPRPPSAPRSTASPRPSSSASTPRRAAAPNPGFKGVSPPEPRRVRECRPRSALRTTPADRRALPADDAIQGFDNIAAALTVSPTLIESYVNAALKISRAAVGDRSLGPTQVELRGAGRLSQAAHVDGLPLGTRGGFAFTHHFPLDATYEIRVRARGSGALARAALLRSADASTSRSTASRSPSTTRPRIRLRIAGGPHTLTVALLDERRCEGVNELYGVYAAGRRHRQRRDPRAVRGDRHRRHAEPARHLQLRPPGGGEETRVRARDPDAARDARVSAARGSWRMPPLERCSSFYERGRAGRRVRSRNRAGRRAAADRPALPLSLRDPCPKGVAAGRGLSHRRLRARLAACRFSSGAASPTKSCCQPPTPASLHEPAALERQIRRMLADARSAALVENFAGQWLKLRELDDALPQDSGFDANLRDGFSPRDGAHVRARDA